MLFSCAMNIIVSRIKILCTFNDSNMMCKWYSKKIFYGKIFCQWYLQSVIDIYLAKIVSCDRRNISKRTC